MESLANKNIPAFIADLSLSARDKEKQINLRREKQWKDWRGIGARDSIGVLF